MHPHPTAAPGGWMEDTKWSQKRRTEPFSYVHRSPIYNLLRITIDDYDLTGLLMMTSRTMTWRGASESSLELQMRGRISRTVYPLLMQQTPP